MVLHQSYPTLVWTLIASPTFRSHPMHCGVFQTIGLGPTLVLKHAISLWNVLFPLLYITYTAHWDSIPFYFLEVPFITLSTTARSSPAAHTFWYLYCSVHHSQIFLSLSCISTLLAWRVLSSRSFICTLDYCGSCSISQRRKWIFRKWADAIYTCWIITINMKNL